MLWGIFETTFEIARQKNPDIFWITYIFLIIFLGVMFAGIIMLVRRFKIDPGQNRYEQYY
jgi:hypothetical protein